MLNGDCNNKEDTAMTEVLVPCTEKCQYTDTSQDIEIVSSFTNTLFLHCTVVEVSRMQEIQNTYICTILHLCYCFALK